MTLYDEMSKFKNVKKYKGEFGLEIETEGLSAYPIPQSAFWNVHIDDSLRGPSGYEYVLKVPLMFDKEIPEALAEFKAKVKGIEFNETSFTTSVHAHVNMLNEKYLTIGNFLIIYCIVENLLKKFAGPTRESNLFCLPFSDAEENYNHLLHIIECLKKKHINAMEMDMGAAKYAALNLCALYKYGSFEIRLLRGTTDIQLIHDWLGMLHSILQYARQDVTPKEIILLWKNKGPELLSDIFGQYRKMLRFQNEEKLIEQNFWYAANAAMVVPDWRALDKAPTPKKLSSKNLDELSKKIYGFTFDNLTEEQKHIIIKNFKYIVDDGEAAVKFDPFLAAAQIAPNKLKAKVAGAQNPNAFVLNAFGNGNAAVKPQAAPAMPNPVNEIVLDDGPPMPWEEQINLADDEDQEEF